MNQISIFVPMPLDLVYDLCCLLSIVVTLTFSVFKVVLIFFLYASIVVGKLFVLFINISCLVC